MLAQQVHKRGKTFSVDFAVKLSSVSMVDYIPPAYYSKTLSLHDRSVLASTCAEIAYRGCVGLVGPYVYVCINNDIPQLRVTPTRSDHFSPP